MCHHRALRSFISRVDLVALPAGRLAPAGWQQRIEVRLLLNRRPARLLSYSRWDKECCHWSITQYKLVSARAMVVRCKCGHVRTVDAGAVNKSPETILCIGTCNGSALQMWTRAHRYIGCKKKKSWNDTRHGHLARKHKCTVKHP